MAIISSKPSHEPTRPNLDSINPPKDNLSTSTQSSLDILNPEAKVEETSKVEENLRPTTLQEYIGQDALKGVVNIAIQAAKTRQEALDHVLLYGPPGLGKTTIAMILAKEMEAECKITSAPALEHPRDIVGLLMNLKPYDVLFIDEIHRLNRTTEELLYPAMEDFRIDLTIGKGKSTRIRTLALPPFTLIGATTQSGKLSAPLRDRFGLLQRLQFYTTEELRTIIERTANRLHTRITPEGATEVGRRARGTPRIAIRILKQVRNYAQVKDFPIIDQSVATEALDLFQIDRYGLDWTDRQFLSVLVNTFGGKPAGLETIASCLGEDKTTLEDAVEPFLMQIGFLQRTPRGRIATNAAREHLQKSPEQFL